MSRIDALLWAKKNSRSLIRELSAKHNISTESEPTCVFMAGLPGSGKTEFTKRFIEASGIDFVRIDMDEIASNIIGYLPERANEFREAATLIENKLFDAVLKKKYDFVMDGTFRSKNSILGIERALKHNFDVKIIYIFQDPRVAWNYTCAREKVEHRAIDFDGFTQTYYEILENLKKLNNIDSGKFSLDLVIKDKDNNVLKLYKNIKPPSIDQFVNIEYNKESLKKYIKND